jgi:hypothetical protein
MALAALARDTGGDGSGVVGEQADSTMRAVASLTRQSTPPWLPMSAGSRVALFPAPADPCPGRLQADDLEARPRTEAPSLAKWELSCG